MSRAWLGIIGLIVIAAVAIGVYVGAAKSGGQDDGLLHLAGVTSLLRDGEYPIVQRPPLYGLLLSAIARLQGISMIETQPLAQELGSIDTFEVADGLLQPAYLRGVMVVHLALWIGVMLLVAMTLRSLQIEWRWVMVALILLLLPSSWSMIGRVSETMLCQLLLMIGVFALAKAGRVESHPYGLLAGTAFALAGITKPTFQLLSIAILVALLVLHRRSAFRLLPLLLLPYLLIVGGWSVRNQIEHGFAGGSGIGGVALSTRTALYLEQAQAAYPEEVAIFRNIRDQLFIDTRDKNDVVYWGARASNWLMGSRGMTYLEANRFLTGFNLRVIREAPLNYLYTVSASLINFHFPGVSAEWGTVGRLVWSGLEFALMIGFIVLTLLWVALWVLYGLGVVSFQWQQRDSLIALLLTIYAYTALISTAVDVGKPEHRMTVQMLVPLMIMLIAVRRG